MEIAAGDPRRLALKNILAASQMETGLSHIGEPDILAGLRVLLDAFTAEAHLNPGGIEAQRATLVRVLSNRMRIEDAFRRHPEILDEEIRGPIIIVGLPRSGTTKMQRMLAASPGLQKLPLWKILHPVPLGPMPPDGGDPRIAAAEQMSAMMRDRFPDFFAAHPMLALEPDEEEWFLDLTMRGYILCHTTRIPSFEKWMDRQDFSTWYTYLRRMLQLLQWQDKASGKTWLLKAPSHLQHMVLLFRAFPDATIVHCHRDPVTSMSSFAAVTAAARRMFSDYDSSEEVGRFVLAHWARQMQAYLQQRPPLEKRHRFVDVSYTEIVGDTNAAIERIYTAAGIELTLAARDAMREWAAANPPGKHGQHRYEIEGCGLSASAVRAAFSDYLERFGSLL